MASSSSDWGNEDPYTGYPRRNTTSNHNHSRWPAPGIYVNMEFGVSFSQRDGPHTATMKYATRGMEERMHRQQQQQQPQAGILMQPYGQQPHRERGAQQQQHLQPSSRRRRRLGVRARDPHERGRSAPPTLEERHLNPPVRPVHTSSFPLEERPLPPLPSTFRLGEPDLPWSTPTFVPSESDYEDPTTLSMSADSDSTRGEDPQRVRDLETLHQAMMTIDSLEEGGWDAWSGDSFGDMPRGPRGLGWAVSSNDHAEGSNQQSSSLAPPPYVVSQWEEMYGGYYRPGRPRSSG